MGLLFILLNGLKIHSPWNFSVSSLMENEWFLPRRRRCSWCHTRWGCPVPGTPLGAVPVFNITCKVYLVSDPSRIVLSLSLACWLKIKVLALGRMGLEHDPILSSLLKLLLTIVSSFVKWRSLDNTHFGAFLKVKSISTYQWIYTI